MAFMIEPGWAEVIVGVIALLVTIYLYRLTKNRKSLSYQVLSESPLISISDDIKSDLKVLYKDKEVENVHLLLIRFVNDGNVPVAATDFERPLSVNLEGEPDIISAEVAESIPANLDPLLEVNNKVIKVAPTLMNAGDSFNVKVLVGEYGGKFDVDARILGVKSVRALAENVRKVAVLQILFLAILFGVPIWGIWIAVSTVSELKHYIFTGRTRQKVLPTFIGGAIIIPKETVSPREEIKISCQVYTVGEKIKFRWFADRGRISPSNPEGDNAVYTAPATPGLDTVTVVGASENGGELVETRIIKISESVPAPSPTVPTFLRRFPTPIPPYK